MLQVSGQDKAQLAAHCLSQLTQQLLSTTAQVLHLYVLHVLSKEKVPYPELKLYFNLFKDQLSSEVI